MKLSTVVSSAFAFTLLAAASQASAAEGTTDVAKVDSVKTLSDGDVHINVNLNICNGKGWGYVNGNEAGVDHILSTAMAAQLSGKTLRLSWTSLSATSACHIVWAEML